MLHSDVAPEHECSGELIEFTEIDHVKTAICLECGTEASYVPDSDWVKFVTPGMRTSV